MNEKQALFKRIWFERCCKAADLCSGLKNLVLYLSTFSQISFLLEYKIYNIHLLLLLICFAASFCIFYSTEFVKFSGVESPHPLGDVQDTVHTVLECLRVSECDT